MNLENQVCSFEQAKRLMSAGIDAPHLFKWQYTPIDTRDGEDFTQGIVQANYYSISDRTEYFPAYTCAELIAMNGMQVFSRVEDDEEVAFESTGLSIGLMNRTVAMHEAPTVAQGLAALLLDRLFWKEVAPDEVNARLSA